MSHASSSSGSAHALLLRAGVADRTRWKLTAFRLWRSFIHLLEQCLKSVEAIEPERLIMRDPIDERPQSLWLDPIVDEATLTPFGHQASTAERGEVLGDGRPGDVEARRDLLHRGLS